MIWKNCRDHAIEKSNDRIGRLEKGKSLAKMNKKTKLMSRLDSLGSPNGKSQNINTS